MSSDAKVRMVAFVSSTIAEQYAALSRRFGLLRNPEDLERPIRRKVNTESGEVEQQIRDVEHGIRGN